MTPKEKAKELIDNHGNDMAFIMSDELFKLYENRKKENSFAIEKITYWQEVKHEIEKL